MAELYPVFPVDVVPALLTSFVGREREVAALRALVADPVVRLVSLTGPGGVGKTRLALRLAADVHQEDDASVAFVELAGLADPAFVAGAIAQGIDAIDGDGQPIDRRARVVILDNFEQVIGAAPLLPRLLDASERLTIVVTSRTVLGVSGEHVFAVPPLPLPPVEQAPVEEIASVAAVRLFVERTRAIRHDFRLTDENAASVARICRALEGLPLEIELAAARCNHLSPAALLARLERRLTLLSGGPRDLSPRLQCMRNAVAWSFDLLGADERAFLARLSVYAGGFDLAAARAVAPGFVDEIGILDAVSSLMRQSLVRRLDGDQTALDVPRFGMFETIREYAAEQLTASGDEDAVRAAHAAYVLRLADVAVADLDGPNRRVRQQRLAAEQANLQAALAWASDAGEDELARRLAAAIARLMAPSQCDGDENAVDEADVPEAARPLLLHSLSSREIEVLRLIVEGKTNRYIADALFISHRTVTSHVANIFGKLGVHARSAAAAFAVGAGLV